MNRLWSSAEALSGRLILASGWQRAGMAALTGALSALALPPFDLVPLLWLTIPALVWLLDGAVGGAPTTMARLRATFATGYAFGAGYFLAGLWWIGNAFFVDAEAPMALLPIAVLALPLALAVFHGFGAAVASLFWSDGWSRLVALGFGLGLAEWARGSILTGFPWNTLGQPALSTEITLQAASLFGLFGVTPLAVTVFALPALLGDRAAIGRAERRFALVCVAGLAALLGFGVLRLSAPPAPTADAPLLRLVQPAIDQGAKWSAEKAESHFARLLELSAGTPGAEPAGLGVALVLWPETAVPFVLATRPDALAAIGASLPDGAMLATGGVRLEPPLAGEIGERAFNSIYLVDDGGLIAASSDKVRLVPFGEFLPLAGVLGRIGLAEATGTGFEAGPSAVLLEAGRAGRLLPLICYEAIFPAASARLSPRPDALLNITNDAWFGRTPGPYQHARQALVRAVEQGLPMIRVANSGISFVSDGLGRITASLLLGQSGALDARLPPAVTPPLYARYGEAIPAGILLLLGALAALGRRRTTAWH